MASHAFGRALQLVHRVQIARVQRSTQAQRLLSTRVEGGVLPGEFEAETERVRELLRSARGSGDGEDMGAGLAEGRRALKAYDELLGMYGDPVRGLLGVEATVLQDTLYMTREQRLEKVRTRIEHVRSAVERATSAAADSAFDSSDDDTRNDSVAQGRYAINAYSDLEAYSRALGDGEVGELVGKLGSTADLAKMKKDLFMSRKQRLWIGWRNWF